MQYLHLLQTVCLHLLRSVSMRLRASRVLLYSLGPVVLLLGCLEVVGRTIPDTKSRGALIPHDTRGWTLPVAAEFEFVTNRATTNRLGLRSPEPEASPTVRILSIGDSTVFGHGVDDVATYSARLAARSGADVQNAGVPGYTCEQSLHRYRELADTIRPDILLVYTLHNDVRIIDSSDDLWLNQTNSSVGILKLLALGQRHLMAHRKESRLSVAEYRTCLREIVDEQSARGGSSVLVTPFSSRDFEKRRNRDLEKRKGETGDLKRRGGNGSDRVRNWRREYRKTIEEVSEETGSLHVNLRDLVWTKGATERDMLLDEVHPTALGHDRIAERVYMDLVEARLLD